MQAPIISLDHHFSMLNTETIFQPNLIIISKGQNGLFVINIDIFDSCI